MANTEMDIKNNELLRRPEERQAVRITTYMDADLHKELMMLKKSGISIKKLINKSVGEFLMKHEII